MNGHEQTARKNVHMCSCTRRKRDVPNRCSTRGEGEEIDDDPQTTFRSCIRFMFEDVHNLTTASLISAAAKKES